MPRRFWQKTAHIFGLNNEVWKRHANPLSVWTRFSVLPLFALAAWSRVWLGEVALLLVVFVAFWAWLNPRLFSAPRSTENWASRAVLGERVWLQSHSSELPEHHRTMPVILSIVAAIGIPFVGWGVWYLQVWPLILGMLLIYTGKVWFLDRMVWLYLDRCNQTIKAD